MPRCALTLAADHPAFAGHFPVRPLVPGVVLLALAQQAVEAALGEPMAGLASAKFLQPLGPGEPLWLDHVPTATGVGFELRHGRTDALVASGRFLRAAPKD